MAGDCHSASGGGAVTVAPRLPGTFNGDWGDTLLPLPRGIWVNTFTDARLQGGVSPTDLFGTFPVALLARDLA